MAFFVSMAVFVCLMTCICNYYK